tara:strand:- start:286 stop:675 length:390 start_codon:yes stop_codon:yes gene_type:complete
MAKAIKKEKDKKYSREEIRAINKRARDMRTYAQPYLGDGTTSTHLMGSDILDEKTMKPRKKGPYKVFPMIVTDDSKAKEQSFEDAKRRGEVFTFNNLKQAQKFEKGGWKNRAIKKGKFYIQPTKKLRFN